MNSPIIIVPFMNLPYILESGTTKIEKESCHRLEWLGDTSEIKRPEKLSLEESGRVVQVWRGKKDGLMMGMMHERCRGVESKSQSVFWLNRCEKKSV